MIKILRYLPIFLLAIACSKAEDYPQPGPTPGPEPQPVAVESVSITPETADVIEGDTLRLTVTVLPENATDKSYKLSSSKESVAVVDSLGLVTALSTGTAVITATAGGKTASSLIKVIKDPTVYVKKLSISDLSIVLKPGESRAIVYKISPTYATEPINWTSDNESTATVNSLGEVTAVAEGNVNIIAETKNCRATIPVSVISGNYFVARVDPLTRILNNQQYADETLPVRVARGETVATQICLTPFFDVTSISASVQLPDASLTPRLYWEREITCSRHWDGWAGGAASDEVYTNGDKYLDPLMPMDVWNPAPAAANKQIVLWCEFDIPRSYTPGLYEATVTFDVNGGTKISKTFEYQVYSATLPEKQGLTIINWETGDFCAMNGGQEIEYHTTWEPLMTVLVEFMNDYGQNAWRTKYASKSNTSKPAVDYTTTPPTIKYSFGSLWEREFNLYINKCRDLQQVHGLQCAIRPGEDDPHYLDDFYIGAYFFDPVKVDGSGNPELVYEYCYANDTDDHSKLVKAGFSEFFRQLGDFLKSKQVGDGRTWLDLYAQTISDEPRDLQAKAYSEIGHLIKAGCPEMKITDAIETNKIDPDAIDYPCPTLLYIDNCLATGNQVQWMYTCMSPQGNYANRFIRIPTIKTRIVHWCNYYYNAPAYLHWGLKYWQGAKDGDAYGDAYGQFIGGDSFIIYPDYRKVYPSIRLCAMRDGIRDYDLLKAVEAKNASKANEFLGRVVKGAADYDTDVKNFRETRREMLEYLSE